MESLASLYRPKTFEEVLGQDYIKEVLINQIKTNTFTNCYLFAGPSGDGKTTLARIFANEINNHQGMPIEIDGASNNGVDNVRAIIADAYERSLTSKYKVYIIDECHQITTAGWNAFLKCIEEPPVYTIFIFCTTDPQKVPETIQNRVIKFNLTRIDSKQICDRLCFISKDQGFINYTDTCEYISKLCNGSVRTAISYLEKCASYNKTLSIENASKILNLVSYDDLLVLVNDIIDGNIKHIISVIDTLFLNGV